METKKQIYSREELEKILKAKAKTLGFKGRIAKMFVARAMANMEQYKVSTHYVCVTGAVRRPA